MLPSLGRGGRDFDDLAQRLVDAGYRAITVDPRGIGDSAPGDPVDNLTLHDYASDVAEVVEKLGAAPAVVLGHAFGNRVARCVAVDHPDLVRAVVLLACGGLVPPSSEVPAALGRILDTTTTPDDLRDALSTAFFAPGNDPDVWRGGWYPEGARVEARANSATPVEDWWDAGTAPVLVVQGLQDRFAVPENGRAFRDKFPDRVTLVELDGAGHALLPEVPGELAAAVIGYLHARP
jgi:pimeloyl-ACP methyl ester carboxylesterase